MFLLDDVIESIVGMGVEAIWNSVKRREKVLKVLKEVDLDPDPPDDFEGLYAYTLVEYGISKPAPILNFFRRDFVIKAFKQSFYENNPAILKREAEETIRWNEETGKLGRIDYDPRREFAAFTLVFNKLVNYSRTPAEVKRDQKLDVILAQLEHMYTQELSEIRKQIQNLLERDKLQAEALAKPGKSSSKALILSPSKANVIRWLHLSDFHVGKDGYGQARLFKSLIEHIHERININRTPDMIFITGDIANKGQASEYQVFYTDFYKELYEALPARNRANIFIVPGNHDVDRMQARTAQTYGILGRIPEFLDPTATGQSVRREIFPRFQAFVTNDATINAKAHWLFSSDGILLADVDVKGHKLGIVGMNTAWLSCSDLDRHQLSVGRLLLAEGLEKLTACEYKLVLGHHPLDWLLDADLDPTRAVLGRHRVIYLHGHMHKSRTRYDEGAGYPFVSLQSGACFQAREDDQWVNRLLWCELDPETDQLWLEPLQWSRDDQEWTLDAKAFPDRYRQQDRWVIPLPKPQENTVPSPTDSRECLSEIDLLGVPAGWKIVDAQFLTECAVELEPQQALTFFDGRSPRWREALSPKIPRRDIVYTLCDEIETARAAGELRVALLTGAAGEGKSTAFLQTAVDIVRGPNGWRVLWHEDTATPLPEEFIARLAESEKPWLILSDDAEMIAKSVYEMVGNLRNKDCHTVQFLLCARDTDWNAIKARQWAWRRYAEYTERTMRGLTLEDAYRVVGAWEAYGEAGLKELDGFDLREAAQQLVDAAQSPRDTQHEGTFLGAMLEVRWGSGLQDHITDLLSKLHEMPIANANLSLMVALAYIAALHKEGLYILSKTVLARVLNLSPSMLAQYVLGPLGEEAAIATTGEYVYTRHQAIAEAVWKVLSEKYYIDIEEFYISLVKAALTGFVSKVHIPRIGEWNYLSTHFFDKGNQSLGINLAQTASRADPYDPYLIAKLAQLYRKAGDPDLGMLVFREANEKVKKDRAYYAEWGATEGNAGNHALDVWLLSFSLADQITRTPPDNKRANISLNGMSLAFAELYDRYKNRVFIEACGAAAQLGLTLDQIATKTTNGLKKNQHRAREAGVQDFTLSQAFANLEQGLISAWEQREEDLPGIPAATRLTFRGLKQLLRI